MEQVTFLMQWIASIGPYTKVVLLIISFFFLYMGANVLARGVIIILRKIPFVVVILSRQGYYLFCKGAKLASVIFYLILRMILYVIRVTKITIIEFVKAIAGFIRWLYGSFVWVFRMVGTMFVQFVTSITGGMRWLYKSLMQILHKTHCLVIRTVHMVVMFVLNMYKTVVRLLRAVSTSLVAGVFRAAVVLKSSAIRTGKEGMIAACHMKVFLWAHCPTRRMWRRLPWMILVFLHTLLGTIVGALFLGYLLLLLPQGVIPKGSLEVMQLNYPGLAITGQELSILIPIGFLVLAAVLAGLNRLKEFLRPPSATETMSLFARVLFQAMVALSVSGMTAVLWEELRVWGRAGIAVVLATGFLGLMSSYFFMINRLKNDSD